MLHFLSWLPMQWSQERLTVSELQGIANAMSKLLTQHIYRQCLQVQQTPITRTILTHSAPDTFEMGIWWSTRQRSCSHCKSEMDGRDGLELRSLRVETVEGSVSLLPWSAWLLLSIDKPVCRQTDWESGNCQFDSIFSIFREPWERKSAGWLNSLTLLWKKGGLATHGQASRQGKPWTLRGNDTVIAFSTTTIFKTSTLTLKSRMYAHIKSTWVLLHFSSSRGDKARHAMQG